MAQTCRKTPRLDRRHRRGTRQRIATGKAQLRIMIEEPNDIRVELKVIKSGVAALNGQVALLTKPIRIV